MINYESQVILGKDYNVSVWRTPEERWIPECPYPVSDQAQMQVYKNTGVQEYTCQLCFRVA